MVGATGLAGVAKILAPGHDVSGRLAREGAHPIEQLTARLDRVLTGERVRQFEYRDRAAGVARATRSRGGRNGRARWTR